jgi:uncharacterized pyridoxamine 5'-phosphate oxidase family protein
MSFLKKCETYFIATMDGDQPRVRPFGTVAIFKGKLYIQKNKNSLPAICRERERKKKWLFSFT